MNICVHISLSNIGLFDETDIVLDCDCVKSEVESLFVEFVFNGAMYTVGGIYRHPNGNNLTLHLLWNAWYTDFDTYKTTVLAGVINNNIIKFSNGDMVSYVSQLLSLKYLPYISVPSRITTYIDPMLMKASKKVMHTMSGLFYCEITDHLRCFLSL